MSKDLGLVFNSTGYPDMHQVYVGHGRRPWQRLYVLEKVIEYRRLRTGVIHEFYTYEIRGCRLTDGGELYNYDGQQINRSVEIVALEYDEIFRDYVAGYSEEELISKLMTKIQL